MAGIIIRRKLQCLFAKACGFDSPTVFFIGRLRDLARVVNDLLARVAPRLAADC